MAVVGDAWINIHADTSRVRQQIRSALDGAGDEFERAGREAGDKFNRGFSRSGQSSRGQIFSKRFEADLDRARNKLSNMVAVSNFLGPALYGLVGGIAALGSGLFTLSAAASQAGPALIVLPAIFTSVAQAAITLKLAFSGVGAALSAGLKGGGGGGAAAVKRDLSQIKNALDQVAEARKRLTQVIRDNAVRRLEVMEAARDAQERVDDAVFAAAGAEREYQQSILNTRDAQEKLNRARREAIEDLQQLRFESEGAALSEKRARLEFDKTREALRRVQDLPPNSRARQEAELAFAEADLNLRRAIDKNNDLKKEEQDASKAGVEGSQKVIDAQKEVNASKYAEESALRDVISAQKDVVRARVDAARASREVGIVERENADRQREAVQDLKDALKDVADARKKAFEPKGGGGGGSSAFADAMSKLSKEAQDFVRYLISIQDEFKKLKAAAGEELFPKLTLALKVLVQDLFPALIPLLRGTGGAIGDVAIRLARTITEAGNLERLNDVWKLGDYLIRAFGLALSNVYEIFLILVRAAEPLIKRFATWVVTLTEGWKATALLGERTGSLAEMFNRAGDVAAQLGRIFSNLFGGLRQMIQASVGPGSGGQFLLDFFEQSLAKFKELRTAGNKDGSLKKYFLESSVNASLVLSLLNDIFKAIMRTAGAPEVGQFAQLLREVVSIWEKISANFTSSLPLLGQFAIKVSEILLLFSDSEGVEIFFVSLNKVADTMLQILNIPLVKQMLPLIAAFAGVAAALRLTTKLFLFFGKAILGYLILIPKLVMKFTGLGYTMQKLGMKQQILTKQVIMGGAGFTRMGKLGALAFNTIKLAFVSTGIGAIIVGITTLIFGFAQAQMNAKFAADALTDSIDEQTGAFTDESIRLVTDAFREDITTKKDWLAIDKYVQMSQEEMAAAVLEGGAAYDELNAKIDAGRATLEEDYRARKISIQAYNEGKAALSGLSESVENQGEVTAATREQYEIAQINLERLNETNRKAAAATAAVTAELRKFETQAKMAALQQKILEEQTEAAKEVLNEFKDELDISQAKDDLANATKEIRQNIRDINMDLSTSKGMQNFRDEFRTAAQSVIDDALKIGGTPEEIETNIKTGMAKVKTAFIKEAPDKAAAKAAVKDFTDELGLLPDQISTTMETAANTAKEKAKNDMKPTGQAVADGIIAGVDSKEIALNNAGARAYGYLDEGLRRSGGIQSPSKEMAKLGGYLVDGLSLGVEKNADKAVNKFNKIIDKLVKGGGDKLQEWGEEARNRFQEFVDDVKMVGDAVRDMSDGFKEALTPPEDLTLTTPLERATEAASEANTELDKMQKKLSKKGILKDKESLIAGFSEVSANLKETLIASLQEAQAEYDEVKARFTTFKDSVVSALTGGIDLSAAIETAKEGGGSVADALNAQAEKARGFGALVNRLISSGFSLQSLNQVIAAGVDGGTEIANALLSGGTAALQADQSINNEMIAIAESIAAVAHPVYFKEGEDLAAAQVDGIKSLMTEQMSEDSKLQKTMKRLAKKLGKDVRINVSLSKSQFDVVLNVSRYVNDVKSPGTSAGASVGRGRTAFGATGGIVKTPTYALIGEAGPEAVIPLNQTPGNSPLPDNLSLGGPTINVYPSAGMDERELAALVSREISFMMRKGSI